VDRDTRDLLSRLSVGPAFLFLGQASESLDTGGYRLLGQSATDADPVNSPMEIQTLDPQARRMLYATLANVSRESEIPEWLEAVARYPWNGVLTSRIDAEILRAFESDWRRVVPGFGSGRPRHPRNSSELRVWQIYGGVTLPDEEQPPLDSLEFATRKRIAMETMQQLPNGLVTPAS